MHVDDKLYEGDCVADGFFDSISSLKTLEASSLLSCSSFESYKEDYRNILKICQNGEKIPLLSITKAEQVLKSIKPSVTDLFSMTGYHYIYGGQSGIEHFQFVMNNTLEDMNNLEIEELNLVWACILHKGHNKDRFLDSS